MTPRLPIRLPRLTLFTGGKECSLCEVAKQDLAKLRRSTPFELDLWNIRDPPQGTDEREAKKWRRLYQYDIPVLHLEDRRVQKHRIDQEKLRKQIEEWQLSQGKEGGNGKERFHEYRSILKCFVDTSRDDQTSDHDNTDNPSKDQVPPWRKYIGRIYLEFSSPIAEYTPENEWDEYRSILESTFAKFSDIPVGSDIEVIDLSTPKSPIKTDDAEMSFEIDVNPTRGIIGMEDEGGDVVYDEPIREIGNGEQGRSNNQTCWNCLSTGHSYMSCPKPKNHMMIRHSRDTFLFQRDYVMPEYVQPALDMYWSMNVTFEEKQRRLKLVDQFGLPSGRISEELQEATCFFIPEDEDGEGEGYLMREKMEVKRRRKRWDWYEGIMRWGYPPGWIAGKDPVQEVRRRLELLEVHEKAFDKNMYGDEDDQLEVFGGNLGTPSPAASVDEDNCSSGDTSGSDQSSSNEDDTDENSDHQSDMEMDLDHDNDDDSVPRRLEKVKRLSINGFRPSSPISHPVKSPSPPFRPPTPLLPQPPPPPPPARRDISSSPRPPTPPLPPPPLPEEDIPPPPPDDIPPPPPAAPSSPTSHPNPFLRQYYALHTPISGNIPPSTGPRNQYQNCTPPTGPRNRNITPQSHLQNSHHHFHTTNPLTRIESYTPQSSSRQSTSQLSSLPCKPTIPHTPLSTSSMRHPPKRWVKYHTDLFDSERLVPYNEGRPFPIGHY